MEFEDLVTDISFSLNINTGIWSLLSAFKKKKKNIFHLRFTENVDERCNFLYQKVAKNNLNVIN